MFNVMLSNVVQHIKDLRRPITIEINGKAMKFLTIGHVAAAVHRTTACIKLWERTGLFPVAPYRLTQNQMRIYPQDFVRSLHRIREQGYLGRRLERSDWRRFQTDVWRAMGNALPAEEEPNVVTHSASDNEGDEKVGKLAQVS